MRDAAFVLVALVVDACFLLEIDCTAASLCIARVESRNTLPTTTSPHHLHHVCLTRSPLLLSCRLSSFVLFPRGLRIQRERATKIHATTSFIEGSTFCVERRTFFAFLTQFFQEPGMKRGQLGADFSQELAMIRWYTWRWGFVVYLRSSYEFL